MGNEMTREEFAALIKSQGYKLISDDASLVPGLRAEIFSRSFDRYYSQIQLYVPGREPQDAKWGMSAFWSPPDEDLLEFIIGKSDEFSLESFASAHKMLAQRLKIIARSAQVPKKLDKFARAIYSKK